MQMGAIDSVATDPIEAHARSLQLAGMVAATGQPAESFCMACYDGKYPVPYDPVLDKHIIERRKRLAQTLGEAIAKDSEQIKLLQD